MCVRRVNKQLVVNRGGLELSRSKVCLCGESSGGQCMSDDVHAGVYVMQKRDKRRKRVGGGKIVQLAMLHLMPWMVGLLIDPIPKQGLLAA